MTCYKLVTVKFKWWGLETLVTKFAHYWEKKAFINFHCQMICCMDEHDGHPGWLKSNMAQIEQMEKAELEEIQKQLSKTRVKM